MATSSTSSLGFRYRRQSRKEMLPPGPSFNYQPLPRFSSRRRTAAKINPFARVNVADGRTVSSAPSLSGNSGVCSWILKFLTDRADDGPTPVSPLLRVALFGSRYKLGAPIVDSRVSHRPVTNEWLTGYILETFFVALLDVSVFNAFKWRCNAFAASFQT
jgi:hypothetical protein